MTSAAEATFVAPELRHGCPSFLRVKSRVLTKRADKSDRPLKNCKCRSPLRRADETRRPLQKRSKQIACLRPFLRQDKQAGAPTMQKPQNFAERREALRYRSPQPPLRREGNFPQMK